MSFDPNRWDADEQDESTYTLAFPFIDRSDSFAHGYEAGSIGYRMLRGEVAYTGLIHTENEDQIRLMAAHYGYHVEVEHLEHDWSALRLRKQ